MSSGGWARSANPRTGHDRVSVRLGARDLAMLSDAPGAPDTAPAADPAPVADPVPSPASDIAVPTLVPAQQSRSVGGWTSASPLSGLRRNTLSDQPVALPGATAQPDDLKLSPDLLCFRTFSHSPLPLHSQIESSFPIEPFSSVDKPDASEYVRPPTLLVTPPVVQKAPTVAGELTPAGDQIASAVGPSTSTGELTPSAEPPSNTQPTTSSSSNSSPCTSSDSGIEGKALGRSGWRAENREEWVAAQKHAFTAWLNFKFRRLVPPLVVKDIIEDLSSGTMLCALAQQLIPEAQIKYKPDPTIKLQMVANLVAGINAFQEAGLKLVNVGPEDIYDHNETIILGLIWSIILKYQVSQMEAPESLSSDDDEFAFSLQPSQKDESLAEAKSRLLEWVRSRCEPYDVPVDNFTTSFTNGRVLAAVSSSIDAGFSFAEQTADRDARALTEAALDFNERVLDIPKLLNPDYLLPPCSPDEKSVITYVSLLYQFYASRPIIVPEDPQQSIQLHIGVSGYGLKAPLAHLQNLFQVSVVDIAKDAVLPSTGLLNVEICDSKGNSISLNKYPAASGATEFSFVPPSCDTLTVRIEYDGSEVASLQINPSSPIGVAWNPSSQSSIPVGVASTLRGRLINHLREPISSGELQARVFDEYGNQVPCACQFNAQGEVEVAFSPLVVGRYCVEVQVGDAISAASPFHAVKGQLVAVGKSAHLMYSRLPQGLSKLSGDTKLSVVGPDGQVVPSAIGLSSPHCPLSLDFVPPVAGAYVVMAEQGDACHYLSPIVAASDLEYQVPDLLVGQTASLEIPWTHSFDSATLRVLTPSGTAFSPDHAEFFDRDGYTWLRASVTPSEEGDYQFVARDEHSSAIDCLICVVVTVPLNQKTSKPRPKEFEVISIVPVKKPDKGLVRVYLGDDELPMFLGISNTFKTHPLTPTTTYGELREHLLRKFTATLNDKQKKKVQAIAKREQYTIIKVNLHGEDFLCSLNGLVLPDIRRFQQETSERVLHENRNTSLSSGPSSSTPSSSSSGLEDLKEKKDRRISASADSGSRLHFRRNRDEHNEARTEVAKAREGERKHAKELLQRLDTETGWNRAGGTFKLIVVLHSGESLISLPKGVGMVYCTLSVGDTVFKTSKWNLSHGEPQWESRFQVDLNPHSLGDMHVELRHTNEPPDASALGFLTIPIGYLQPDMAKKAWYTLKKPLTISTLTKRRVLITLEHHVLEIEPDTRLFLKPAPRLFLEIKVNYPRLRMRVGENLDVTVTVRDEKKGFALTNNLKEGTLELFVNFAAIDTKPSVLPYSNPEVGYFIFTFRPTIPGKYRSMLKYSGAPMQRKIAVIEVQPAAKSGPSLSFGQT